MHACAQDTRTNPNWREVWTTTNSFRTSDLDLSQKLNWPCCSCCLSPQHAFGTIAGFTDASFIVGRILSVAAGMLRKLLSVRHGSSSLSFKRDFHASNPRLFSPSQLPAAGDTDQGTTRVTVGGGKVTLEHLGPGIGALQNTSRVTAAADQIWINLAICTALVLMI